MPIFSKSIKWNNLVAINSPTDGQVLSFDAVLNKLKWITIGPAPVSGIATGTYAGDGAATKEITGIGFQPKVVIIYPHSGGAAFIPVMKTNQDGLYTAVFELNGASTAYHYETNVIISLDADGFTVGNSRYMNDAISVYTYIALG